jgi:hypothetical protein
VQQRAEDSTTLTLIFRELTRTPGFEVFKKEHLDLAAQQRLAAWCELIAAG